MEPSAAAQLAVDVVDLVRFTTELLRESCAPTYRSAIVAPQLGDPIKLSNRQEQTFNRVLSTGVTSLHNRFYQYDQAIRKSAIKAQAESFSKANTNGIRSTVRGKEQGDPEAFPKASIQDALKMVEVLDSVVMAPSSDQKVSYYTALQGLGRSHTQNEEAAEFGQLLNRYQSTIDQCLLELERLEQQQHNGHTCESTPDASRTVAMPRSTDFGGNLCPRAHLAHLLYQSVGCCRVVDAILNDFATSAPHERLSSEVYARLDGIAAACMRQCVCGMHSATRLIQILIYRRHFQYATAVLRLRPHIARQDYSDMRKPLFCAALGISGTSRKLEFDDIQLEFLEVYLNAGVDVNVRDEMTDLTAWESFLRDWRTASDLGTITDMSKVWQATKLFIEHGAALKPIVNGPAAGTSVKRLLEELVPARNLSELYELIAQGGRVNRTNVLHLREQRDQASVPLKALGIKTAQISCHRHRQGQMPMEFRQEQSADEIEAYYQRTGFRP